MTAEVKKFTFDTEFRPEGDLISNAARARQKKVVTQDDIDNMLARAREQGMKVGQVRAAEATAASVEKLCDIVHEVINNVENEIDTMRREAAEIALTAARKLAHFAVSQFPEYDVEEALREAVHQAIAEPRIVLRAAPVVVEAIKPRLDELAQEMGYEGRLVATQDPSIQGADCRIEWRGGGAERNMQHLEETIGEVIFRHLSQADTTRKG